MLSDLTVFMNTDRSEEELKQVVLHVSEIEKVVVKQGESLQEVDSTVATQEDARVEEMIQPSVVAQVEAPIETVKQPVSALPTKSTAKRKMLKVRIVPFVCS